MPKSSSPPLILWGLASLGLFTTGIILIMLFWMTNRIDALEHERARDLAQLAIQKTTEKLVQSVEDYAYWTLAYHLVQTGSAEDIYENIGSAATETVLFDQLVILNHDGDLLHAFDDKTGAKAVDAYDPAAMGPIWQALNENSAEDPISKSTVVETNGVFYLAVAAWITTDEINELPEARVPALIGMTRLDGAWQNELARQIDITGVTLIPFSQDAPIRSSVTLPASEQPVARLTWDPVYSGTTLRNQTLPLILVICVGIIVVCGSTARYFQTQHASLQRATKIARTDQLTGLLNRAGLEEQLQSKHVTKCLESGHLAVIYLDINDFKKLNDALGHRAGDIALRVTAERLVSVVGDSGFAARLGGDEFVCVIVDENPEAVALAIAERIVSITKSSISFDGQDQIVMASIGISVATPGTQWEALLSQSDSAMYWSKKKATDQPVIFCKSMDSAAA